MNVVGLISKNEIKSAFTEPILFSSERPFPETRKEVESLLASIDVFEYISKCSKPSSLSLRTKKLLDSHFQDNIEIGRIAIKLKTNPATLSRIFKLDYGYPPAFYKKGLKVTSGMFELMMGTPPAEAALLAGYTDLSRFYKQFKEYLKQTPAQYLEKSKNAKN